MGYVIACMIWCDDCCAENWDDVSRWLEDGRARTRSGVLVAAAVCRSCEAALPVGSSVEAVTVHNGGRCPPWEDRYLGPDAGSGKGSASTDRNRGDR